MDLVTRDGKYFVTKEDYDTMHLIKHQWGNVKNSYFSTGRKFAEMEKLFNKLGVVSELPKTPVS